MNVCSPLIFIGVRGFDFIILFYFLFFSSGKSDLPSFRHLSGMVCRLSHSVFPLLHPPSLADCVAVPLSRVCCLLAGVHAQYGFNTAFETGGESPLGFRDDRPEGASFHPFMTSYTSLLNTSLVSGKASPLNVGIELGVRFELSPNRYTYRHRRKYPCRCLLY